MRTSGASARGTIHRSTSARTAKETPIAASEKSTQRSSPVKRRVCRGVRPRADQSIVARRVLLMPMKVALAANPPRRDGECDEEEQIDRRNRSADDRRRRGERKCRDPEQEDRCKRRQPVGAHRPPAKEETVVRSVDHGRPRTAWSAFPAYRRPWPFLPPPFAGAHWRRVRPNRQTPRVHLARVALRG